MYGLYARVHNKRREESVKLAIRVYNNSSESNATSGLAHVIMPNAKTRSFHWKETRFVAFMTFSGDTLVYCDALLVFSLARTIKHLVGVV